MCKVPGEDKGLETRQDWGLESRDHWCCMERAMMDVMPALAGMAAAVLVALVVVVGVCGGAGRGEGEENSLEWEGEGDEAAEGDRALPTSSASAATAVAATMTGCLPLPVLVPRCVLEPLCDLDRNRRRLGFLRSDVPAGGGAPSDDEVEDDEEEADEEDGREGAVKGVVPNPSVDRTRCIVPLVLLVVRACLLTKSLHQKGPGAVDRG